MIQKAIAIKIKVGQGLYEGLFVEVGQQIENRLS
jgi:hypothetical protein